MAASQDFSSGSVPGPDEEPREPRPWPRPGLAWLPLQCQAFPSEPRSWAEMAGGPGLLPGSLPASQAPRQGWVALCNHCYPGWPGQAGSPGWQIGSMLPCCGLSTRLGRAVCQDLQVPAWIPALSQGASKEAGGCGHILPSRCTCLILSPASFRPFLRQVWCSCPPHSARPSACTQTAGKEQVPDRTPAPSPNAAASPT